jgi:hypothetical protein
MSERRGPMLDRPVMRAEFRKELRGRLMREAVTALAPRSARAPWFAMLRPALAAAAILVLVLAGATNASASSLPGDPLYAVKRASENVELALTFDDVARMRLLSTFADRRLAELAEIAKHRPASAPTATQEYSDAVERFAQAVDQLRDADSEDKREAAQAVADAARAKHKAVLDAVKEELPDEARPEVEKVIEREEERSAPSNNQNRGGGQGGRPSPKPTPKK